MGTVWLARDEMLDREVAVKELTLPDGLDQAERADAATRSVREAQATAQLRHPGIVALHDVIVEQGRPWLVMELLRGRTLAQQVSEYGRLPAEQVARIGADMLDALTVAHAHGLQHRDVKPGNIFLTDGGRVVLTDFGIARQEGLETLTQAGMMIGSPGFIAPERLEGEPGGPASDLWSLAATLFVAAEGRPPYPGSPTERIRATLTLPPPQAGGPIGPLLAAMMARHPAARPDQQSALTALRQVAEGRRPQLPPAQESTAPGRSGKGRKKLWIPLAAVVVALSATGAFLVVDREPAPPEAFTLPIDVCSLVSAKEVGELLKTKQPPKGDPGSDSEGPTCGWELPNYGISVQVQHDSDTPNPWSMTPQSAHQLFVNQERVWDEPNEALRWTWEGIGAGGKNLATSTKSRRVAEHGEEAFAYELKGPDGRVHTAYLCYRLANLVVRVNYTTLANKPTDVSIKDTAVKVATVTEQALRRAG